MRHEITLPQVAEGVNEAFIAQWMVQVGDHVALGDDLVEVMTDKVNIVLPAEMAGTIAELCFDEEARVEVGAIIAVLTTDAVRR